MRCATEELSAFLIQLFEGEEAKTQYRWWLSLKESHARFKISLRQKSAWLDHMAATLSDLISDPVLRRDLMSFFAQAAT